jgi:hypothetical protein
MSSFRILLCAAAIVLVPFSVFAQQVLAINCGPTVPLTTATAVAGAVVCPISVTTSTGAPYTGLVGVGARGGATQYFAVSASGAALSYLPANLRLIRAITSPGSYNVLIFAGSVRTTTVLVSVSSPSPPPGPIAKIVTHLYDNLRTGWNSNETTLNTTNVASSFGLLRSVPVDEQVDAQPLVFGISGGNDQIIVATENNTIYRIDAVTGAVLTSRHLGPPVPQSSLPGSCINNSSVVGITSTPVIDTSTSTLYAVTYTLESGTQTYRLHQLDLFTLADKVGSGAIVTASAALSNGATYNFNAKVSRQRAALLEANGNIYAAFASFCDLSASQSRGWLLGWNAATLAPLAANELADQLSSSPNNFFLTSIWMSGAGPAADENGSLFFVTGNSDPSGTSYDPTYNLAESVVEMSPDLSKVIGAFTPSNQPSLDHQDLDLGAGGVLLVPHQAPLPIPYVALAQGKYPTQYLLDRSPAFAGPSSTTKISSQLATGGGCLCTSAYFIGSDGVARIASGGASSISTLKLLASGGATALVAEHSQVLASGQDPGVFPSVSSNGTVAGSQVIWAVARPRAAPFNVNLVAFDNLANKIIYTSSGAEAGTWPNGSANANIVPVVADGLVFVGSYKNLAIFGIGGTP